MNTYWLKGLSPNERLYENIIQHPYGMKKKIYNEIHGTGKKKEGKKTTTKNKIHP